MKKRNYIKTAIASLLILTFSSCLKDSRYYVNLAGSPNVIEFPVAAFSGEFETASFDISSTPSKLNILVNLASPTTSKSIITVKFALDTAALDAYNTANGTSYTLLPAADYSTTFTTTIPAGQRQANLLVNVNTSLLDPTQQFVLPIVISNPGSGNIVSGNYGVILYSVSGKNMLDGEYSVTGTLSDNTDATITGTYPNDVDLITSGATSVAYFDVAGDGYFHEIGTSTGPSEYGSYAPVFTFDANNNVVSVTNYFGQFSGSHVRSAALDPAGVNKFTKGTPGTAGSVFQVTYYLEQGDPGVVRTTSTETFTYIGPR